MSKITVTQAPLTATPPKPTLTFADLEAGEVFFWASGSYSNMTLRTKTFDGEGYGVFAPYFSRFWSATDVESWGRVVRAKATLTWSEEA